MSGWVVGGERCLATDPPRLWGRGLRFVLVDYLISQPEATVAELAIYLNDVGYAIAGRPSKVISDSLRWEIRRGRVVRLGRGRYRYRAAPRTTARRIRRFAEIANAWIVAIRRREEPPPLPLDRRKPVPPTADTPSRMSPWDEMSWL